MAGLSSWKPTQTDTQIFPKITMQLLQSINRMIKSHQKKPKQEIKEQIS